jgi:hypothetical protein
MRALLQRLEDERATVADIGVALRNADVNDLRGALRLVLGALDDAHKLAEHGSPRTHELQGHARHLLARIIGALDAS